MEPQKLALVAVIVGAVLRVAKGALPSLPKKFIPVAAVLLGAAALGAEALASGKTLAEAAQAAVAGLFAGSAATAGHEIVVEGFNGGKEIGK